MAIGRAAAIVPGVSRLTNWAEQALKVVDDSGECTQRVRLITADGSCWQTWSAPFEGADQWAEQAEALLSELAQDWSGETECMFVAENASGVVRTQLPRVVNGRRKKGAGGFGGQGAPLQQMYEAQAKTVERTLSSANVQLEVLTRTVERQAKANAELLDYIRAQNEQKALAVEEEGEVKKAVGQLLEQAPLLLEMMMASKKAAKNKKQSAAAAAAEQVGETVKQVAVDAATNGAKAVAENLLSTKETTT